ncbi:mycofactocin biosynthesis peptidyl-dipeptidase MftE [Rhodococcus spelaei]|uniref:Mycofactocin biosynthesis peptidyl-dipeptidase MftE n=1 Tax=Rhodococcus spelaei TaxID=2546320 RepID=A0A541B8X8_9NOCA|nr:mycofactocin biosynthesis peptidyl-dipeptidase MftE [Rhodococcus spelaei]TQF68757.1 mycofactocin biosynthesis peptidyl-dipeptidase MftE [Rhodococcus spelaei]
MPEPLADATWPEIADTVPALAVPVGSLEQHGPHLPLDTDTRIAVAVAAALPGLTLAPAIAYGASGEHEGFAGTVSIGSSALQSVVVEYGRSACRWSPRVLFVNGHGGNAPALAEAVALLRYEGRDAAWLPCAVPGADAHAGCTETSLLLHISPVVVRLDRAEPGDLRPVAEILPAMRESGVAAVSANGVLGDPTAADATAGARMFEQMVARSSAALARWQPDGRGMLR